MNVLRQLKFDSSLFFCTLFDCCHENYFLSRREAEKNQKPMLLACNSMNRYLGNTKHFNNATRRTYVATVWTAVVGIETRESWISWRWNPSSRNQANVIGVNTYSLSVPMFSNSRYSTSSALRVIYDETEFNVAAAVITTTLLLLVKIYQRSWQATAFRRRVWYAPVNDVIIVVEGMCRSIIGEWQRPAYDELHWWRKK